MKKLDFRIPLKRSNKVCPKHGIPLVAYKNKTGWFCIDCEREKMDLEKQQMTAKFVQTQTKGFLQNASLLDRQSTFKCTFDTFKAPDKNTHVVKQYAETLAKMYVDNPSQDFNSLFYGKSGAGKTHLAMAVLNYINDNSNQKCLFISVPKLLQRSRNYMADKTSSIWSPQFIENMMKQADVVVIDDLGAESKSGNATDFVATTLFSIYESNQRIITTTNLSVNEIKLTYGDRLETRVTEHGRGHMLSFNDLKNVRQF